MFTVDVQIKQWDVLTSDEIHYTCTCIFIHIPIGTAVFWGVLIRDLD